MPLVVADLQKDSAELKDKLNAHVRLVTFGLLAFAAGIIGGVLGFGSSPNHPNLPHSTAIALLLVMVSLFLVLLIDMGQTVLSILTTDYVINDVEVRIEEKKAGPDDEVFYDYEHWAYRGSTWCFWSKIVLLTVTTIGFACITARYCILNLK